MLARSIGRLSPPCTRPDAASGPMRETLIVCDGVPTRAESLPLPRWSAPPAPAPTGAPSETERAVDFARWDSWPALEFVCQLSAPGSGLRYGVRRRRTTRVTGERGWSGTNDGFFVSVNGSRTWKTEARFIMSDGCPVTRSGI